MPLTLKVSAKGLGAITAYLDSTSSRLNNLGPAMQQVGQMVLGGVHRGFETGSEPSGRPWAPLKQSTWARKTTKQMMVESGALQASMQSHHTSTSVIVGTPLEYGGHHQTGYRHGAGRVPARPVVDLAADGLETAAQILLRHINGG